MKRACVSKRARLSHTSAHMLTRLHAHARARTHLRYIFGQHRKITSLRRCRKRRGRGRSGRGRWRKRRGCGRSRRGRRTWSGNGSLALLMHSRKSSLPWKRSRTRRCLRSRCMCLPVCVCSPSSLPPPLPPFLTPPHRASALSPCAYLRAVCFG